MNRRDLFGGGVLALFAAPFAAKAAVDQVSAYPRGWVPPPAQPDWSSKLAVDVVQDPLEKAAWELFHQKRMELGRVDEYEHQLRLDSCKSISPAAKRAYLKQALRKHETMIDKLREQILGKFLGPSQMPPTAMHANGAAADHTYHQNRAMQAGARRR